MVLPKIKWHCNSDDDFVGSYRGYILRVEQMNKNYWWWCIYAPKKDSRTYVEFDNPRAHTMSEAIDYAISAFYFDYISTH